MEAILINTSGGLTGGDRLNWEIDVGEGAALSVTSAAYEKIYRAQAGTAEVSTRLRVGESGRLAWIPQETLFFNGGRLGRRLEADLEPGATLLLAEAMLLGRTARGERVVDARLDDHWAIRRGGRLLHAEAVRLEGSVEQTIEAAAGLGGSVAYATLLLADMRASEAIGSVREVLRDTQAVGAERWGASAWEGPDGKLLARLVARDGYRLRQSLIPLLAMLTKWAGLDAGLPRIWTS